jgi:hypothetical protein
LTVPQTGEKVISVPARPLLVCLAAAALAFAGCGSDDEPGQASAADQQTTTNQGDAARVAVSAEPPASPGSLCRTESRKKSSKVGKSAFALCVTSVAKAKKTKSAAKACKGLSSKRDKTLGGSPKSICKRAAKKALKGKKDKGGSDSSAAGDDTLDDTTDESDPDAVEDITTDDADATEPDVEPETTDDEEP